MSYQQSGLNFEHELANDVFDETDHELLPMRAGYSGNQKIPAPDILIEDGWKCHFIEVRKKKQGKNSCTFEYDTDPEERDDIWDLLHAAHLYPRTTTASVGVKFANRQFILTKLYPIAPDKQQTVLQNAVTTCPVEAIISRSDNLVVRKPNTDLSDADWPSAQKGNDAQAVLDSIDYS